MKGIEQLFRKPSQGQQVIAPPEQVFANPTFTYLFTKGGHLVEDGEEYGKLMKLLHQLGEKHIQLVENLGATETERKTAIKASISTQSSLEEFNQMIEGFDPPFGFVINHFYVYGSHPGWGIYLCEYPTINIIGCLPEFKPLFAQVYGIQGDGFNQLESFLDQEYEGKSDLKAKLKKEYKINNVA